MTVQQALQFGALQLTTSSDAPQMDADRLLLHVLNEKESSWLTAHGEKELTKNQEEEFERLVAERATGKPLAYILGEWEFYGRTFYITPDVLVPRPETENLITAALPYIDVWREKYPGQEIVIADLGTGSGIIAITILLEVQKHLTPDPSPHLWRGELKMYATDISPAALRVATKNAQRHGVENPTSLRLHGAGKVEFIQEDMALSLGKRKIDLIVSNPPYVPTAELQSHFAEASQLRQGYAGQARDKIETKGLNFEPRIALDGGRDGQDFVRQIQATEIPAIVETTGGVVKRFNF